MSQEFFERPILNSPYEYPAEHWEIDESGQPTQRVIPKRRPAEFLTPIPKPRRQSGAGQQVSLNYGDDKGISTERQRYEHAAIINGVREQVDKWRQLPETQWRVTPETARLLKHWRHHKFSTLRPFFCQVEAAETAIWLTEVAPKVGGIGRSYIQHLKDANAEANPDLFRIALKLATGAGKTTVMAMLIAWQTVNAVRRPNSKLFTKGFLVVAPGLTIRDRPLVLRHRQTPMMPMRLRDTAYANRTIGSRPRRFGARLARPPSQLRRSNQPSPSPGQRPAPSAFRPQELATTAQWTRPIYTPSLGADLCTAF